MKSTMLKHVFQACAKSSSTRWFSSSAALKAKKNVPLSGNEMPRSGGIASMMRLPIQGNTDGLDVCFVGVPLDSGTSNRTGARLGPRQIRQESCIIRGANHILGTNPYEHVQVADIGDVSSNIYNLPVAVTQIKAAFDRIVANGCIPLVLGGDHTISLPVLQAIKDKYGPVGMIHLDAHADINDAMLGATITHGTPFRRAVEYGCLDCNRVIQIGIRGSIYSLEDFKWAKEQGFRMVTGKDCWNKSLEPLMAEVREMMGNRPVYISFDIDALDPSYAPGTGTPEIGGLSTIQALEVLHGCAGLNIVGADLVEVSPQYDMAGTTALTAANLLFEMLCILPGVKRG